VVAHTDKELAILYGEADEDERFLLDFFIRTMVRDHEAQIAKYSDLTGTTLTVHGKQHKTRTVEISQRLALAIRERKEAARKNGGSEHARCRPIPRHGQAPYLRVQVVSLFGFLPSLGGLLRCWIFFASETFDFSVCTNTSRP